MVILDRLLFGKPNELVRGSVFALDRKTVFAITAERKEESKTSLVLHGFTPLKGRLALK